MRSRKEQKAASLERILDVTARRIREEGVDGAAIAKIMQEAGLTHGAFYAHFNNKDELAQAGFRHAVASNHPVWFEQDRRPRESFGARLKRLAKSYINRRHRDNLAESCALAALASDVPRSSAGVRQTYEDAYRSTIAQITEDQPDRDDAAIVFFSLCVGSLLLARGVEDEALSDRILQAARDHIDTLA